MSPRGVEYLNCPFCAEGLQGEGEVELLRGAHLATRLVFNANWRELVVAELYRCRGCGFLALFSADDSCAGMPQADRVSSDVQDCPKCAARNFRRENCHACAENLQ